MRVRIEFKVLVWVKARVWVENYVKKKTLTLTLNLNLILTGLGVTELVTSGFVRIIFF